MSDPAVIVESWRRSSDYGVVPSRSLGDRVPREVDLDGPLMYAAAPVLREFAESLRGSGYSFVLGDKDARVLERFGDTAAANRMLDERNIEAGHGFAERDVGTNALGTALELRSPVLIQGGQHYHEELRVFTCLGQPIVHPLTHRLAGVLDLTGIGDVAHPFISAMMRRVVHDIEDRLLERARCGDRQLLTAFHGADARRGIVVVAIGDDVLFANRCALDLLQAHDFAVLRSLIPPPGPQKCHRVVELVLSTGRFVRVEVDRVVGGCLFTLAEDELRAALRTTNYSDEPRVAVSATSRRPSKPVSVIVSGAPGSGRSTQARELAGERTFVCIPAAGALIGAGNEWCRSLNSALSEGDPRSRTVCLDDLDVVPDSLIALVTHALKRDDRPDLVLVVGQVDDLGPRAQAAASMCTRRVVIQPLAERRDELPAIAGRMLQEIRPGTQVRLAPSALEALLAHSWPGNLNELRAVLSQVAGRWSSGDIVAGDLPEAYRSTTRARRLGGLERAERDAITRALETAGGNKVQAAKLLGISRTTLYARMRQLRIVA